VRGRLGVHIDDLCWEFVLSCFTPLQPQDEARVGILDIFWREGERERRAGARPGAALRFLFLCLCLAFNVIVLSHSFIFNCARTRAGAGVALKHPAGSVCYLPPASAEAMVRGQNVSAIWTHCAIGLGTQETCWLDGDLFRRNLPFKQSPKST